MLLEEKDNDEREEQFPLVFVGPGLRRDDERKIITPLHSIISPRAS
jgi:hypothetical protein